MSRHWCSTLNNYTDDEILAIESNVTTGPEQKKIRYLIYGLEIAPETGTPHLQMYFELHNTSRLSALKKLPGFQRAWLGPRTDTRIAARKYCMKNHSGGTGDYYEFGSWEAGGQGARTDWHAIHNSLEQDPNFSTFRQNYPEEAIKYHHGVNAVIRDIQQEKNRAALGGEFSHLRLYKWQGELLDELEHKAHDRKVIWYHDQEGNKGKTKFGKYLIHSKGAALFSNARTTDIAHCYKGENIAVFDFTRSNEEQINYQAIEMIKNGIVFSPKYDSQTKVFATPHIICFANFEPNRSKLSQDRWDVRTLGPESTQEFSSRKEEGWLQAETVQANADDLQVDRACNTVIEGPVQDGITLYNDVIAVLADNDVTELMDNISSEEEPVHKVYAPHEDVQWVDDRIKLINHNKKKTPKHDPFKYGKCKRCESPMDWGKCTKNICRFNPQDNKTGKCMVCKTRIHTCLPVCEKYACESQWTINKMKYI